MRMWSPEVQVSVNYSQEEYEVTVPRAPGKYCLSHEEYEDVESRDPGTVSINPSQEE
jgi:hypothetical protein